MYCEICAQPQYQPKTSTPADKLESRQSACWPTTNPPKFDWGECGYSLTRCRLRTLRTIEELWNSSMRTKVCQTQTLQNKNNIGLWNTTERVQPKLSKSPEIAQAKEKAYLTQFYAGTQKKKMVGFDPFHNFSAPHQLLRLIKNAPRTVKHTHPSHILCISFDMHIIKRRKNWWERQMEQLDILQIILWIVSTWGTHARLTKRKASIPCDSSIDPYNAKSSMDSKKLHWLSRHMSQFVQSTYLMFHLKLNRSAS